MADDEAGDAQHNQNHAQNGDFAHVFAPQGEVAPRENASAARKVPYPWSAAIRR
jgi:hypothetical protein